jgi:hypothetical protein
MSLVERARTSAEKIRRRTTGLTHLVAAARVLATRVLTALPGDPGSTTPATVAITIIGLAVARLAADRHRRPGAPDATGGRSTAVMAVAAALATVAAVAAARQQGMAAFVLCIVVNACRVAPGIGEMLGRRQGRRATCGCHMGSMSARRGFFWSRADRIGSVSPQSAPTAGSSQATPSSSAGL